ncbi:hypothetical protein UT300009_30130 [Paraclostridium bifermentans]
MKMIIGLIVLFVICMFYRMYEESKWVYPSNFLYGFCGFIEICCLIGVLICISIGIHKNDVATLGEYKYSISIPQGKYVDSYYADDYEIGQSGAISFTDMNGNKLASSTYKIRINNYYLEKRGLN